MNVWGLLRSVRVRLTLWYVFLLTAGLIAFSATLYGSLSFTLHEELDDTLRREIELVVGILETDAQRELSAGAGQSLLWSNPLEEEQFWRVLDASGRLLEQNGMFEQDAPPVDPKHVERALAGREIFQTAQVGIHAMRVLTAPVKQRGQTAGVVQLGLPLEDVNDTLNTVRWLSILILPAMMAAAGVGGFFLANRALRPVDQITRTAQTISASDLSQRLELDLPDDELGRLANTFDGMIARLEGEFRRQRRFTADASHELRTPLTIIKGDLTVALDRPRGNEYYQEVLAALDEEVDQMSRLVDRLLYLARADAEGISIRRQTVDLADLLGDLVEQMRSLAESKGLDLTAQFAPDLTASVDPDALTQVVLNLLDNAIKYTSSGNVCLSARRAQLPGGEIQISVSDSGPGIPPEHISHIFDRFYRVDRARSRKLGGVGLGLSIARQLARAHGGDISVTSAPGEGSTFTVHLPEGARDSGKTRGKARLLRKSDR